MVAGLAATLLGTTKFWRQKTLRVLYPIFSCQPLASRSPAGLPATSVSGSWFQPCSRAIAAMTAIVRCGDGQISWSPTPGSPSAISWNYPKRCAKDLSRDTGIWEKQRCTMRFSCSWQSPTQAKEQRGLFPPSWIPYSFPQGETAVGTLRAGSPPLAPALAPLTPLQVPSTQSGSKQRYS